MDLYAYYRLVLKHMNNAFETSFRRLLMLLPILKNSINDVQLTLLLNMVFRTSEHEADQFRSHLSPRYFFCFILSYIEVIDRTDIHDTYSIRICTGRWIYRPWIYWFASWGTVGTEIGQLHSLVTGTLRSTCYL